MESSHALIHIPGVPSFVTYTWIAMAVIIGAAAVVRKSLSLVPSGVQNFLESIIEGLYGLCRENMEEHWADSVFPLVGTLALFILLCNLMGLIPGFEAPTGNLNTTAACAVPVFFATHFFGLRAHGLHYIKHFLGPMRSIWALPLMIMMFIIELISHLSRPLTLSIRLFGNMMSKHFLMAVAAMLVPAILPVAILGLGVLVSVVQAFVFVLLATLYLAGAVEEAH